MSSAPPVIGLELGVGEFRIVTSEAVYEIRVLPELVTANTVLGVVSQGPALGLGPVGVPTPVQTPGQTPAPTLGPALGASGLAQAEPTFFQEISQELFERVGQLARQLSVSVGEIPDLPPGDLSRTKADLEDAKGQLEEVVELTEKASMTIMDLADQIQADMDALNAQMKALSGLEFLLASKDGPGPISEPVAEPAPPAVSSLFLEKFAALKALAVRLTEAQEIPPEVEPEPLEAAVRTVFDLDAVFQTLYEFCTNEQVKEHIKAMREANAKGEFDAPAVEEELSVLSATLTPDDGFYNFPIPALLKMLYAHTASEQHKTSLKRMNQTVSGIFLENNLPVEGREMEVVQSPPSQVKPAVLSATPPPAAEDLASLAALVDELGRLLPSSAAAEGTPARLTDSGLTTILTADRDAVVGAVSASEKLIANTVAHLTHIMEALSFQDLSGQRIKKIVGLIGEIQVQLLSVLVSVNSKIKAHHDAPTIRRPKEETEKVAQAEVDKMLERLNAEPSDLKGPGAENRLDQSAVNDMLAQLGF
ncbi:MAG: protein phosphatase CheZ [Deltaproteobacteria bacterium]|jgi:chemotaxis regulatin CheY-phosphate phosphatase CheZ|nr:protein phosphatase CheZ [Deltaproteobacteria bacterium]